jgi:hypothetical protein
MIDTTRSNLRFFAGSECDNPEVRSDTTDDRCNELTVPSQATENDPQVDATISAADLVGGCDSADSAVDTIWVLAVNNPSDAVSSAGQKVTFNIAHDFSGPDMLTGFEATGGESSAMLSWDAPSGQTSSIEVYLDPSGCTDIADPPDASLRVATIDGAADGHTLPFPDSIAIGSEVGIAVRTIDNAGNAGALSNTVCVRRFEVMSWWEAYCQDMPDAEVCASGGGCAVSRSRSSLFAVAFAALALAFVLRRSR